LTCARSLTAVWNLRTVSLAFVTASIAGVIEAAVDQT
jgi:hypothetical protein